MRYYQQQFYNTKIHIAEAHPSEGILTTTHERGLEPIQNIKHDYFEGRGYKRAISVNMKFFNGDGTPNGAQLENRDSEFQYSPTDNDQWIEMIWKDDKLIIDDINVQDFENSYLGADFVSGVMPLLKDGQPDKRKWMSHFEQRHPRTAFGQKANGDIVFIVTDGRPAGLTWNQTAEIMKELKCVNAVMFDGGGSSGMLVNNKKVNNNENRKVYNALLFYSNAHVDTDEKPLVVLDGGHHLTVAGKQTPIHDDLNGHYGNYIKECEQNYPIMEDIGRMLEYNGVRVEYTNRDMAVNMSLSERVNFEKSVKPDMCLSVHKNATKEFMWNSTQGTETYCLSYGFEAEKIANFIQASIIEETRDRDRGVKEANFYFLKETGSPAVLLELGFMTNLDDAKRMKAKEWHYKYAKGTARGICRYFGIDFNEEVKEDDKSSEIASIKKGISDINAQIIDLKSSVSSLSDRVNNL